MSDQELLSSLASRCAANLAASGEAKDYLRSQGVCDESVWAKYRLGVGFVGLRDELTPEQKARLCELGLFSVAGQNPLTGRGILIPTYQPPDFENPVGFITATYAQNKHRWATAPKGIACPKDIADQPKVVIADAPLLALRLANAGARGVVLAESPEVLPSLQDWLKERQAVVCSYKRNGIEALKAVLPDATGIHVPSQIERASAEVLGMLGIAVANSTPDIKTASPATVWPALIKRLVEYAQSRLASGQGRELLEKLCADVAEFVAVYGLGYLPRDFAVALSSKDAQALDGKNLSDSIIVPAFDADGIPVDLLAIHEDGRHVPVLDEPHGLIAPRIAGTFPEIAVSDSIACIAKAWKQGHRHALLIRGMADAQNNAERLYKLGVRTFSLMECKHAEEVAEALTAAGLVFQRPESDPALIPIKDTTVEPLPTQPVEELSGYPLRPALVGYDPKTELATFKAGDATYLLEVPIDADTKLQVRMEREGCNPAVDRFDFAVEQQRKRFAQSAALRLGVPFECIMEHLVHLLDEAKRLQSERLNPNKKTVKVEVTGQEKQEALSFLKKPDLLDAIAQDLEELGWVGEATPKRLLYMVSVSRKLEHPLSASLLAPSGSGKSHGLETISLLAPPEDVLHVSRLTDSSLYYADGLAHKLLLIDEADALTPEVMVALRVLQSRGVLSQAHTERDAATGQTQTRFDEAKGPVAILTTTAGELEEQLLSRCYELRVDDSPEQTKRILEAQRRLRSDKAYLGEDGRRATIIRRHHALQRLLSSMPVVIPFANRIEFPASSIRFRREQERFLNLIEASTLLHQHQRLSEDGVLIADERDFAMAVSLASDAIGRAGDELDGNARDVLGLVLEKGCVRFSLNDLRTLRPDWTRHRLYSGLEELARLEVVVSTRGRGKVRQYELVRDAAKALSSPTVRLRPMGQLSKLSGGADNNFTPRAATG